MDRDAAIETFAVASPEANKQAQNFIWWDIVPLGEIGSSDKTYTPM